MMWQTISNAKRTALRGTMVPSADAQRFAEQSTARLGHRWRS